MAISNKQFSLIIALCIFTYLLGFSIPLMDIDASQYASISREMLSNNSWLQVFDLEQDYLDKPPMLFWLSAISMKIFGLNDWAYRLPSLLFLLLAIYSTYRFALLYYNQLIAQLSAIILAASQALFLISHDVRTDTMLMGWVIFAIWQLANWFNNNKWKHFLLGCLAIAGGMMTKGPIALVVPGVSFFMHFLLQRNWKVFFKWQYLIAVPVIGLLLLPMSIGLYQQFDLHPGKIINGVPIKSGLRFYYWTQSFGRYTGENVFNEMNHFTFLLENMLWSFLPWVLFFLIALVRNIINLIRNKFKITTKEEWISTGGFILTYLMLARSQAQLPHYIFVVYPLAAIVTAGYLFKFFETGTLSKWYKILFGLHVFILGLLWVVCVILMYWPFQEFVPLFVPVIAAICFVGFLYIVFLKQKLPKLFLICVYSIIGINIFLSTAFYPNVLKYQLGNDAASFINKQRLLKEKVFIYGMNEGRALHFYGKHIFKRKEKLEFAKNDYLIIPKDSLSAVQQNFPKTILLHEGAHFGVTALSLPFLNPATRKRQLPLYLIVQLNK